MKIKFQADADLRDPIVSGVKRRELMIDFKTANEAQLEGLPDLEVLAKAASEAIDGLIRLWATAEAEYWENVISFLPH
jgi:hypothetical protein